MNAVDAVYLIFAGVSMFAALVFCATGAPPWALVRDGVRRPSRPVPPPAVGRDRCIRPPPDTWPGGAVTGPPESPDRRQLREWQERLDARGRSPGTLATSEGRPPGGRRTRRLRAATGEGRGDRTVATDTATDLELLRLVHQYGIAEQEVRTAEGGGQHGAFVVALAQRETTRAALFAHLEDEYVPRRPPRAAAPLAAAAARDERLRRLRAAAGLRQETLFANADGTVGRGRPDWAGER